MGLNIGVRVKRQLEQYMSTGVNPKGTLEEVNAEFAAFLQSRVSFWFDSSVALSRPEKDALYGVYTFDARMDYSDDCTTLYLAMMAYILCHFSRDYGIEMSLYWSG